MNRRCKNGNGNGSRRRMLLDGGGGPARSDRLLPLHLRLQAIAANIPAVTIDELWVFPPLTDREFTSEFIVLVCYDGGAERRRIVTAHIDAHSPDPEGEELEWVQRLREHGTAPLAWVNGMPDRLLQRWSEAGVPEVFPVGGLPQAWEDLLARFANGNGNGGDSGNGHGNGASAGAIQIERSVTPEIVFSTIYESGTVSGKVFTDSGNGTHLETE